jgi:hypothetical protein
MHTTEIARACESNLHFVELALESVKPRFVSALFPLKLTHKSSHVDAITTRSRCRCARCGWLSELRLDDCALARKRLARPSQYSKPLTVLHGQRFLLFSEMLTHLLRF